MDDQAFIDGSPAKGLPWIPLAVASAAVVSLLALVVARAATPLAASIVSVFLVTLGASLSFWVRERERQVPRAVAPGAAAAAAALAADHFRAVLESLEDPVLLVTGESLHDLASQRLIYANAAARELFRTGREAGALVSTVRDPNVLDAVEQALFGRAPAETAYETGGANIRTWRVRANPIPEVGGRRLALLTLRDETEIRRSERTRADFLANASHELRTPLASLTGFIETLRGHARDDPAARERFLGIMQDQAARMALLIEDLMSLSRIELNEHVPPQGEIDLREAMQDAMDALVPLAEAKGVRLEGCAPAEPALVRPADRDQLLQVIQNLTENAVKYAPAGSAVALNLRAGVAAQEAAKPEHATHAHLSLLTPDHAPDQLYVSLRVSGGGPGIRREHLPRLTERFYRVEGQRADRPGTGLGLAIVKHIVNRHRGGLMVESAPGEGADFVVYLPSS